MLTLAMRAAGPDPLAASTLQKISQLTMTFDVWFVPVSCLSDQVALSTIAFQKYTHRPFFFCRRLTRLYSRISPG